MTGSASASPVTPMIPHMVLQATGAASVAGLSGPAGRASSLPFPDLLPTSSRPSAPDQPQGGLDETGQLGRHRIGLGLVPGLDHDPDQGFGAAGAQEDPAFGPEGGLELGHLVPHLDT